jgi:hypothetical protein
MSIGYKCSTCGLDVTDKKRYIEHLLKDHPDRVHSYLDNKVAVTECPGKGCNVAYSTKDLMPSSICVCGYHVGHWAYGWAASFIAANDAIELV